MIQVVEADLTIDLRPGRCPPAAERHAGGGGAPLESAQPLWRHRGQGASVEHPGRHRGGHLHHDRQPPAGQDAGREWAGDARPDRSCCRDCFRSPVATALGTGDQRFSPIAIGHLTHRLVEVKLLLDQLGAEQKELHDTLRLAHLRGDLLHLLPPGGEGGYQLPSGVQLHRRAGRRQWQYGPEVQELEAQLKAQQVYEQTNGQAVWSLGAAFWELRFPKG